jgi:VanZ family protein
MNSMKSNLLLFAFYITLGAVSVLAVVPNYNALPPAVSFSDLLNHAVAFMTLFVLLRCAYPALSLRRAVTMLLGYAVLIEVVQAFLPNRFASLSDIAADAGGMLLGFLIHFMVKRTRLCT